MKTPSFWMKKNIISILMLPLSFLYSLGFSFLKYYRCSHKVSKKVICVGNIIAGGSGKTPLCLLIADILRKNSINFVFLSRGYKGENKFIKIVDLDKDRPSEVGDEPILLAMKEKTYICKNRLFAARKISNDPYIDCIVLDDGMQNNSLKKDLTIVVIDSKIKFGNKMPIPSGPLRQSIKSGLSQASIIVVIGEIDEELQNIFNKNNISKSKIFIVNIHAKNIEKYHKENVIAFCGLAYPEKFFSLLRENNINLIKTFSFQDHHSYNDKELQYLCDLSFKDGATLLTTKKDWVKFPLNFKEKIKFLDISLFPKNQSLFEQEIVKIFKNN